MLAFSTVLSTADRQAVEAYLMTKWLGSGIVGVTNYLPAGTPLTLRLERRGGGPGLQQPDPGVDHRRHRQQPFLCANNVSTAGTLTTGTDNTNTAFAGNLSGYGYLVKTGTGTFTLSGSNGFGGTTTG